MPSILIVEDEYTIAKNIEMILHALEYDVVGLASTGEEAVIMAWDRKPDLILMDIMLRDGIDGIEAAEKIIAGQDIPIIYLTAHTDESILKRARISDPFGYVLKPLEAHELHNAVEIALYKHTLHRQLKEHDQWLNATLQGIGEAVIATDSAGTIRLFNPAAEQLIGMKSVNAIGLQVWTILNLRDSQGPLDATIQGAIRNERNFILPDDSVLAQSERSLSVEGSVSHMPGETSNNGMVIVLRDISARKQTEHILRQSEEKYRSVIEQSGDCIFLVDAHTGHIMEANSAMQTFLGYSVQELQGMSLQDIVAHDPESIRQNINLVLEKHHAEIGERLYRCKDGSTVSMEVRATAISLADKDIFLVISHDISEQKRMQQKLHMLERAVEAADSGVVISDPQQEGNPIIYVNKGFEHITGLAEENVLGRNWSVLSAGHSASVIAELPPTPLEEIPLTMHRICDDGASLWYELHISPVTGSDGTLLNHIGVLTDITAQKQSEVKLLISQEKYQQLIRNLPIAVTRYLIKENRLEFVNDEFVRQSGYTLQEYEQLSDQELITMVYPDDRRRIFEAYKQWADNNHTDTLHIAYRIINKGGDSVWLDTYNYADHDEQGKAAAINQICVDISELKNAETALGDALQEDFRRTVQNLQNLVFKLFMCPDGTYAYSLREGKLAGTKNTKVVRNKTPKDFYGQDHEDLVGPYIRRAFTGESVTFELFFEERWFFYSLEPVFENGEVREVVGSAIDITEQKQTEQQLRESEQRFRILVDNLPVAIVQSVEVGHTLQLQFANREFIRQTGYSLDEFEQLSPQEVAELLHPEDREMVVNRWAEWENSTTEGVLYQSYRFRNRRGYYLWLDNYTIKYRTESGEKIIIEAVLDVTEQKANEEHLQRLASFPEQHPNPIIEITANGEIQYMNPVAFATFPDISMQGFSHPMLAWLQEQIANIIQHPGTLLSREIEFGGVVYEQAARYMPEVDIIRIFCYNITERKRAEEQLLMTLEKEREVNMLKTRFVSTVSHEFRTPLTGILMSAELLERYSERMSAGDRSEEIVKIKKRVLELTELMNDFLLQSSAQSMRGAFQPADVRLDEICESILQDLSFISTSTPVTIIPDIAKDIPPVMGDSKLLRLAIQNLISNAVKYSLGRTPVWVTLTQEEHSVVLQVQDNGIGIPEEEIEKLFTPFYRASNAAKIPGSGIGLSIVKEFVEIHGGRIAVESKEGKGTIFMIYLPLRNSKNP